MIYAKITQWNMSISHQAIELMGRMSAQSYDSLPPEVTIELKSARADARYLDKLSKDGGCVLLSKQEYNEFLHWKTNKTIME